MSSTAPDRDTLSLKGCEWTLERIHPHHANMIASFFVKNREHLLKSIAYPEETFTQSTATQYASKFIERVESDNNFLLLPAKDVSSNQQQQCIIDICGVKKQDTSCSTVGQVGYLIDQCYEGRGIISTTVAHLLRRIFVERPNEMAQQIQQLAIHCDTLNKRSRAVPERLGFQQMKKEDGKEEFDEIVYVLKRDTFLQKQQQQQQYQQL